MFFARGGGLNKMIVNIAIKLEFVDLVNFLFMFI
jgi:hypothetical protein